MELKKLDRVLFLPPLLLLILLAAQPAFADAVFTLGNHPQADEENILFSDIQLDYTIYGVTKDSNVQVEFSSTEKLKTTAKGQADVEADDGLINNLTISLPDGSQYLDLIINPIKKGDGQISINVETNIGSNTEIFNYLFSIGRGENFITITTSELGETILSTSMSSSDGFESLKQPRISGLLGDDVQAPEPTSLLLLGTGLGVIGIAAWRRRK